MAELEIEESAVEKGKKNTSNAIWDKDIHGTKRPTPAVKNANVKLRTQLSNQQGRTSTDLCREEGKGKRMK